MTIVMTHLAGHLNQFLESTERPVARAVDHVIKEALACRASDIHLEPTSSSLDISFRIDGVLQTVAGLSRGIAEQIVSRVKVMSGLITYRNDIPQDGRIDDPRGDFRVSVLPTIHGEKIVIRIFQQEAAILELNALGFTSEITGGLRKFINEPGGVLLLTGPSGSGKTTTIYSILREMTAREPRPSIVTIEEPVEQDIPGVTQTQVNPSAELTFSTGLRTLVRQDPEVIVVGEIRDLETAQTAIEAGLTGHKVISTIHSGSASGVFARLLDMGVPPYLLVSSLTAVLAQRLLRKLCTNCRQADSESRAAVGEAEDEFVPMTAKGCEQCVMTGYLGRMPAGEFLFLDDRIHELIMARSPLDELQKAAGQSGSSSLRASALDAWKEGMTSYEEMSRVLGVERPANRGRASID
ncbi:MAG: GspE/PulE family protein [Planctomycetota bacterium]|nr:GspE/PulE family protein [Planctomycetota bacterium]